MSGQTFVVLQDSMYLCVVKPLLCCKTVWICVWSNFCCVARQYGCVWSNLCCAARPYGYVCGRTFVVLQDCMDMCVVKSVFISTARSEFVQKIRN